MKMSNMLLPTIRELPSDAEAQSHILMLRAALVRQVSSGVYSFLPLGYRVLRKIEQIIREEMDRAGALEVHMPALLDAELYKRSGRWDIYGDDMFRLKDRTDRDFLLGPTHEEVFTDLVAWWLKSYKQLPITLYQIQYKYRDEKRPRYGLIRCKEFVMVYFLRSLTEKYFLNCSRDKTSKICKYQFVLEFDDVNHSSFSIVLMCYCIIHCFT